MPELIYYPFCLAIFGLSVCGSSVYTLLIYNLLRGPGDPSRRDYLTLFAWKTFYIVVATHYFLRLIK